MVKQPSTLGLLARIWAAGAALLFALVAVPVAALTFWSLLGPQAALVAAGLMVGLVWVAHGAAQGKRWRCGNCDTVFPAGSSVCPGCGANVTPPTG